MRARIFLITIFISTFSYCSSLVYGQVDLKDSVRNIISNTTLNDSIKASSIIELSSSIAYSNPTLSLELNSTAIGLCEDNKLNYLRAGALYNKAIAFFQIGKLDSSKANTLQCIKIAEKSGNFIIKGKSYNLLGIVDTYQGNDTAGLQAFITAMDIFRKIGHTSGVGASLNRIGAYYLQREEYDVARQYFLEALELFTGLNRLDQQSTTLNNIGVTYFQAGDMEKSLQYYLQSMEIIEKAELYEQLAVRELNVGKVYAQLNDYSRAEYFYEQALRHAEKNNEVSTLCQTLLHLGILKRSQKDPLVALRYFKRGLELAKDMHDYDTKFEFYENIAAAEAERGNYENAYEYYKNFSLLKDSLQISETNQELLKLQNQFEAKEKEQKISILQHESEKKNIILMAILAGSALITLSLLLILINYKSKQRNLDLIHQQKEEISRRKINELLKDQELNSIKNKLEGQENERKRIAQDLHDGIGGTLASIKMNLLRLQGNQSIQASDVDDVIGRLDDACEEVRMVSHNLIPPTLDNSTLTDLISNFLDEIIGTKRITVNCEFYPKKKIENISKNIQIDIYRIIQELITNVTKHAEATEISIYLTVHDDYINLMVEDNGKGFKYDHKNPGIGLKNIQSRVDSQNGKITIDSTVGNGTIVIIDLLYSDKQEIINS